MKKQIALIIISLLAALPANAQNNNIQNNDMCICPSRNPCGVYEAACKENCINPCLPYFDFCIPPVLNKPCIPSLPEVPDTPVIPEVPEVPDFPVIPEVPEVPDSPVIPEVPEVPDSPVNPGGENTSQPTDNQIATLLVLVNNERVKNGVAALTYDTSLEKGASVRAKEIKTLFSHTRPNGTRCFTVLDEMGYKYSTAGENIAYGQQDAYEVFEAWMNSQGHRENILNPSYTKIGMSVYGSTTLYWAQFFAS